MHIRSASPQDAEDISALILSLSDPFYEHPFRVGADPLLASVDAQAIRHYLGSPRYSYLVAVIREAIVGVVCMRDNCHLFHLFVATPFQHTGIASQLWNHVKAQAMAAGNTGEFTANSSLIGVQLYEKFGFKSSGEIQSINGLFFQPMRLNLTGRT